MTFTGVATVSVKGDGMKKKKRDDKGVVVKDAADKAVMETTPHLNMSKK